MGLSREQFARAMALFNECEELSEGEREALISADDDPEVQQEVRELLKHVGEAGSFPEHHPAVQDRPSEVEAALREQLKANLGRDVVLNPEGRSRVLESGQRLNDRFEVLGFVGGGGIGEVYKARDHLLGRIVALKILRPHLVENHEWCQRFKREARAISSLNHPHICALYDLQKHQRFAKPAVILRRVIAFFWRTENALQLRDDITYLVLEYVLGETLSDRICRGPLPVEDLLSFATQMAEALAYAHQHGLIHRDVKPSNVLLAESGVKLVDFGLAKHITLNSESGASPVTTEGSILGTIEYMSPEQAKGQELDGRSDIFSFGCVLFEMATGRRDFNSDPLSLPSQFVSGLPHTLDQIVCRCLQKSPSLRYQNFGDVLSDLKRINGLPMSAGVRHMAVEEAFRQEKTPDSGSLPDLKQKRLLPVLVLVIVLSACATALTVAWWNNGSRRLPFEKAEIKKLIANGTANIAAVSPDGNFIAYAAKKKEALTLRLQPTHGGEPVILWPQLTEDVIDLGFTGDGAYVSVVTSPHNKPTMRALHILPVDRGTARQILGAFSGPVSLSPDGTQVAYVTVNTETSGDELWLSDVNGRTKHRLREFKDKDRPYWDASLAWSQNSRLLAFALATEKDGILLAAVDTRNGELYQIPARARWQSIRHLSWLNTSGLIVVGQEEHSSFKQLWYISYPEGECRSISNDLNDYTGVSIDSSGTTLVSVQWQTLSNIFVGKAEAIPRATQITAGNGRYFDLRWMSVNEILYSSDGTGLANIYVIGADGKGERPLTPPKFGRSYAPSASPDGKQVAFHSNRSGRWNIWNLNISDGEFTQLTSGIASDNWPQFTPDGSAVVYHRTGMDGMTTLFMVPVGGGKPKQLTRRPTTHPAINRITGEIASWYSVSKDSSDWNLAIFPADGGEPNRVFSIASTVTPDGPLHWTPDGRSLSFLDGRNGTTNIWVQPVDGSPALPLTFSNSGQIYSFAWSPDGNLAFSRGTPVGDVVIIKKMVKGQKEDVTQ